MLYRRFWHLRTSENRPPHDGWSLEHRWGEWGRLYIEKRWASLQHNLGKQNEPPLEKRGKLNLLCEEAAGNKEINERIRNSNKGPAQGKQHESRWTQRAVFWKLQSQMPPAHTQCLCAILKKLPSSGWPLASKLQKSKQLLGLISHTTHAPCHSWKRNNRIFWFSGKSLYPKKSGVAIPFRNNELHLRELKPSPTWLTEITEKAHLVIAGCPCFVQTESSKADRHHLSWHRKLSFHWSRASNVV